MSEDEHAQPPLPCPFCHYDLNLEDASCANCGASLPRKPWVPFYVKLRTLGLTLMMLFVSSVILNDCVLNYLPGGRDSTYAANVSPQQPAGPGPDLKTPQMQALLYNWLHGLVQSQNPNTTGAIKTNYGGASASQVPSLSP